MDKENMNSMKKKALAFAAAACAFGMLLSGCGSSNGDSTADKGSNVITAYNSEPQNPLIPGDCNRDRRAAAARPAVRTSDFLRR